MDNQTRAQAALTILKEFCSHSTVHGIKYFTEPKRHWIERLWWIIAFILSAALGTYAVWNIWMKWDGRPVIVSFDDKSTSISTIPFPAVTACTTRKFVEDKIDTELFSNILMEMERNKTFYLGHKPETLHRLDAIQQVCRKEMNSMVDGLIIPRSESIHTTIQDISPEYDSTILFPNFLGRLTKLRPVYTGEGLCYTFNSLNSWEIFTDNVAPELMTVLDPKRNATHWNMEKGYDSNVDESDIYPYRVFGCSLRDLLSFAMGITVDDSRLYCTGLAPGFRVSLHSPDELPRMPEDFSFIPIDQEVYISIRPSVIATSDGLRRYSPKKRGCYFESERQLGVFRTYGQRNCELECAANYTKQKCGCVQYFMPRNKNVKVCTFASSKCYMNAAEEFSKNLLVEKCDCLPDCVSVTYEVEISQSQKYYSANDIAFKKALNETSEEASTLIVFLFKEHQFISINRTEAYTFPDFIASCGGLLGLCMGISLLSLIELIYYFTLRMCCKLRRKKYLQTKVSIYNKRCDYEMMKKKLERRRF